MKSKPTDQIAGMAQGLDYLLREFDGLDVDMPTTAAGTIAPSSSNPIESTFFVACENERAELRAVADYRCNGTADDIEINAALDACGTYGRVVLGAGRFYAADEAAITIDAGVVLEGAGTAATIIVPVGDITFTINGLMRDITVEGEDCC